MWVEIERLTAGEADPDGAQPSHRSRRRVMLP
jgi:hypothetical protein